MSITGSWDRRISRRDFLAMTGMSTAALALSASGLSVLGNKALAQSTGSEYPSTLGNPFTLGVASGDPITEASGVAGVVLWTRLAPDPLNGGGMPSSDVKVRWEIATGRNADGTLSGIVQQGETDAKPGSAHSVHLEVSGLEPRTHYYYRFNTGTHESIVGRTKTAPKPDDTLSQLKFAVARVPELAGGLLGTLPRYRPTRRPGLRRPRRRLYLRVRDVDRLPRPLEAVPNGRDDGPEDLP
jgi:phosphodiesterase/alkaline phosphatase D-like protein